MLGDETTAWSWIWIWIWIWGLWAKPGDPIAVEGQEATYVMYVAGRR